MRRIASSIFLILLTMIAACGQTGPLFLPGDPSQIQTDPASTQAAEDSDEDDEEEADNDPE